MSKLVFAVLTLMTLAACNTMHGAGKDVSAAGNALSSEATETQREM